MPAGLIEVLWKRALDEYTVTTGVNMDDEDCKAILGKIVNFWSDKAKTKGTSGTEDFIPADDESDFPHTPFMHRSSNGGSTSDGGGENNIADLVMNYAVKFDRARHKDANAWDKIRHNLAKYLSVASGLLSVAGELASLAFPPASILIVAVTRAGDAIYTVSKDLDTVKELFETMISFSERVNLLKKKRTIRAPISKDGR
ncbi:hypothetical protein AOL_s00110g228 [Orbilia oligospora ATCC 24927]|uniref:Fungal STAND N-terminal Goodbye domain-containing protein n=1 Tax=Arthrobotrys oligospora (strain ATCC 24927 / CBS 115.81 / DSM 1491) TaxID=756982 RepID=G1XL58_ARTOA|nr:hypothetical protein AOL_s00110g228 [Orbilia oligospora ATCC 24927]EGX46064.1 hypothetical protein AOL_s00110g228 [Orbilia oligospora ATCC 24927]